MLLCTMYRIPFLPSLIRWKPDSPLFLVRPPWYSIITILFLPLIHLSGMPELISSNPIAVIVVIAITVAMVSNVGCLQADSPDGTLTGNVSISPLCPVEPCSVPRDRLVAAYAARPITISTPGGSAVATVIANPETGYSVSLKPGTFVVDILHQGIGGSRDLPATVTLRSGGTVWLNISIDTGIR